MKADPRVSHREQRPGAAGAVCRAWWDSTGWPLAPVSALLELCDNCAAMIEAPALQPPGFPIWSCCPCRATELLVLFLVKQVDVVFCEAVSLNIHKLFMGLCTAKPSFLSVH